MDHHLHHELRTSDAILVLCSHDDPLENRSTNTGENVLFTKRLLEERGMDVKTFIVVSAGYDSHLAQP